MFENEEKKGWEEGKKTKPEIKRRHQQFVTGKACRGMLNRMNMEKQAAREERFENKKKETRNSSLFPTRLARNISFPQHSNHIALSSHGQVAGEERERERCGRKQKISHVSTPRAT